MNVSSMSQVKFYSIFEMLMFVQLIKQLMLAVKAMQEEVVQSGSRSSSQGHKKEFYAKNSSWTEGLISGGKSLGLSANMLVLVLLLIPI